MTNIKKAAKKIETAKSKIPTSAKTKAAKVSKETNTLVSEDVLNSMIATRAYFLAEHRNFAPGYEINDWLTAEAEIKKQSTIKGNLKARKA